MLFEKEHAEIYDLVYRARGKDYDAEAAEVAELVRARKPDAASLLDVACGTGEHLVSLRKRFDHVEGLDLAEAMREVTRRKLPDVEVHAGDMSDFRLGRTFDAVTCLYSSIAYLSAEKMKATVACMARHLNPGGVLIVEPWWSPEKATNGDVVSDTFQFGDRTVVRMSHGSYRDGRHHLQCHFLVGDADGVRHFTDVQVLATFATEQYLDAFAAAGCTVEHIEHDKLSGRGLYVGVAPS